MVLWVAALCSLVNSNQRLWKTCSQHLQEEKVFILKKKTVDSLEKLLPMYRNLQHYIPEDNNLQNIMKLGVTPTVVTG
jgi:hypothetical protein